MEQMASHSLTRLYLVVSKAVTEETLEYLFGVFEGLEYVDLKRDHASGLSRVSPVTRDALAPPWQAQEGPKLHWTLAHTWLIMELLSQRHS